ncbi:hypothetical protein WICMUC_003528 [Wickerhamomyces mucosus]|uniref:Multivesicular body sorting factor 12 domain-containing protein n=1 Tax=Wickerhamomyces mucosus TaxID=1378264 RepID=A0A9P8TCN0_9ASCO|nr:hypothetical protein WICMUC_003528 [Wickerhamomyces mucosus]
MNIKGHPLLSQVPLTTSPLYNPPKPVSLPYEYKSLANYKITSNITEENLKSWIKECENLSKDIQEYCKEEIQSYKEWESNTLDKLAPGYEDVLTPTRKGAV